MPERPTFIGEHLARLTAREKALNDARDATSSAIRAAGADTGLTVRCWGVRGSIPSPGPRTVRYGGNTTCVEVRHGLQRLIFDAGSGIRVLGQDLLENGGISRHVFLTHFHWDHIQGLPFFPLMYRPDTDLKIIGPKQDNLGVERLLAGLMEPTYFPVPFGAVAAKLSLESLAGDPWRVGSVTLRTIRVKHPSHAVGYRIEAGGRAVCFVPDDEVSGEGYDVGDDWRKRFLDFIHGADVLIHDSMYTDEEYPARTGWGHSTFRQSLQLAEEAEVGKLLLFHHEPDRSDDEIDGIVSRLRDEAMGRGCPVEVDAAAEGLALTLDA